MSRSVRRALLASTLVVALGPVSPGASRAAGAAPSPHRALVIVDTGATTYQRVVSFDADAITGLQALESAGADPVVWSFAGQGGAVCRLFGVGRDAGPNCLGGADGNPDYWAYFRAPAGSSTFTYSRAGAGSTQVRDGDVEGWRFGTGQEPAWSPVPPVTTPTTAPAARGGGTGAPAGGGGGAAATGPVGAASAPSAAGAPSAEDLLKLAAAMEAATSTTTSTRASSTEVRSATARRPVTRRAGPLDAGHDGSGGGPGTLLGLVVALAALTGGAFVLRARRRRPVP